MKNVTSIGVAWWRKFIRRYWLWCWWWLCWWLSTSSCPGGDQATRSPSLPTWFFYHFRWYQCDYCNFHNCSHWKHILNSSFIHPSRISWHNKIYSLCCILISWKYCSVQKSVDMSLPIVWGGAVKDNGAGWVGKGKEKRETSKLLKMFAKIKKIMTSTTRSLTLLVTRNWCGGERAWSSCWWDLKSSSLSTQTIGNLTNIIAGVYSMVLIVIIICNHLRSCQWRPLPPLLHIGNSQFLQTTKLQKAISIV